jgi:hypothetical protein
MECHFMVKHHCCVPRISIVALNFFTVSVNHQCDSIELIFKRPCIEF